MTAVQLGAELPTEVVTDVRADDIKMIALILRDPNPIHFDVDAVSRAGLGDRPISQGGTTMAYVMTMLASWSGSRANVRSVTCRFTGNVAVGDDVRVGGTVVSIARTDGGTVLGCQVWADVVGGRRAIEGTASVFMPEGLA